MRPLFSGKTGRERPLRYVAIVVSTEKYSVKAEEQPQFARLGLLCRLCVIPKS